MARHTRRDHHDPGRREETDQHGAGTRRQPAAAAPARARGGGFKLGAAFFGWLVMVALTVLLAGILGVIAAAVGSSLSLTQDQAQREAGTIGLASAIALLVVLLIAYFAGGYVAGRLARFDGGRQGIGVWLLSVLVNILVAVVGVVFGSQYDVYQWVDMPAIPFPTQTLAVSGIITLVVLLVLTALAAFLGGKAGQRYHTKVDRTAGLATP